MTEDESDEKTICPQCGKLFKRVGGHWAQSSECDYPQLSPRQEDILAGFLLVAGSIQETDTGAYPAVRLRSTNQELLAWIQEELGVAAASLRAERTADDVAESLKEAFGDAFATDSDVKTIYTLQTRNLPAIDTYKYLWTELDDGSRCVPDTISRSPLMLRVMYATAGSYRPLQREGRDAIYIPFSRTQPDVRPLSQLFDGFGPRLEEQGDRYGIWLHNCADFFDYIGYDPLPGCTAKWPDAQAEFTEPDNVCPSCGGRYQRLGQHWFNQSPFCTTPALTTTHEQLIDGLLLAGGVLWSSESNARTASLQFTAKDMTFLEWLANRFEWFTAGIVESDSETSHVSIPEWTPDRDSPPPSSASTDTDAEVAFAGTHTLLTRTHPSLYPLYKEYTTDRQQLLETRERSPTALAVLYAHRGWLNTAYSPAQPTLGMSGRPISDDALTALFEPFDPAVSYTDGKRRLGLTAREDFFDYIGEPMCRTVAEKWPGGDEA